MIHADIMKLIADTLQKKRDTTEPEAFEESAKLSPLTIYSIVTPKTEEDSSLTTFVFDSQPMTEANWRKVQPQIHDILAFT